jgi:hypothetical protein
MDRDLLMKLMRSLFPDVQDEIIEDAVSDAQEFVLRRE